MAWKKGSYKKVELSKKDSDEKIMKLASDAKIFRDSEKYKEYLKFMSFFHKYSWRNTCLIYMQRPNATRVAGMGTWNKMGRRVNKKENDGTGLRILAPRFREYTKKEKNIKGEEEDIKKQYMYFVEVCVWDVTQTTGKELPVIEYQATGDGDLYKTMEDIIKDEGVRLYYDAENNGYMILSSKEIHIKNSMDPNGKFATMVHEMAHYKMGHPISSDINETEAESVCYLVCSTFGIDRKSEIYLAGWLSDKAIMESMDKIYKVSKEIIDKINESLKKEKVF